jgi:hypothetical protein
MYDHLQGFVSSTVTKLDSVTAQSTAVRPLTAQTHNERTSTESNLVTAQSTAHEPLKMVIHMDRNM